MSISNEERNKLIKEKFGQPLFSMANKFIASQINIVRDVKTPIDFQAIVLDDNNREFHIIIDEKDYFIFHDCPYFLKKNFLCFHIIKSLLIMPTNMAIKILNHLDQYTLISEDLGSKLKNKTYLIESKICFIQKNFVEGINYIKKAYLNKKDSTEIILNFIESSLRFNLLIEFFEFSELIVSDHTSIVVNFIDRVFKKLLPSINKHSLFVILRIIESMRKIFSLIKISFLGNYFEDIDKLLKSKNLNDKYFSIFLICNYFNQLEEINPKFKNILKAELLFDFQDKILEYFLKQIDNFCLIDELKLLINHFKIFNIEESKYLDVYKKYEAEINQLDKKAYLKKFAFLKIFSDKFKIKKSSLNLQKKRNLYYVVHDPKNMKIPAYKYIIDHIGFNPVNESVISSQEIGVNYFIFQELYEEDFNKTDILYYKNQFWKDKDQPISPQEGLTLLQDDIEHLDYIDSTLINPDNTILIEWDIANSPQKGCFVNAYDSRQIIPDPNNPLTPELKPFDLCFCKKEALSIEGNVLKTVQIIHKCTVQEAINAIANGMQFIERYLPLHLVKSVIEKEISAFDAYDIVNENPNETFIGNYENFKNAFNKFLFKFINEEKDLIYSNIAENPKNSYEKLILLMNLENLIAGINFDFSNILYKMVPKYKRLNNIKIAFIEEIHKFITQILKDNKIGSTKIFDLKKFTNTPFLKYVNEILYLRKNEFEKIILKKAYDKYDFTPFIQTYYGNFFSKMLKIPEKEIIYISEVDSKKIKEYCDKLGLKLKMT